VLKVLLVVLLLAALTYGVIRILDRRGIARRPKGRGQAPRPRPRPIAPDDDPEFLRDLDRKKRHRQEPEPPAD